MSIQASGEPGLVRPLKKAVEESIKAQIDKSYAAEKPTETSQMVSHEGAVPTRDATITKISSAEFYLDVGRAVKEIIEKRAAKKGEKDEKKEEKGFPAFLKGKKAKEKEEGEEEEEEEEKPEKGKKKKEEEEKEEPKFPIFGKKPKKAE